MKVCKWLCFHSLGWFDFSISAIIMFKQAFVWLLPVYLENRKRCWRFLFQITISDCSRTSWKYPESSFFLNCLLHFLSSLCFLEHTVWWKCLTHQNRSYLRCSCSPYLYVLSQEQRSHVSAAPHHIWLSVVQALREYQSQCQEDSFGYFFRNFRTAETGLCLHIFKHKPHMWFLIFQFMAFCHKTWSRSCFTPNLN